MPCFSSPWPKWARKWLNRSRGDWPTYEALQHVGKFACYLVPESPRPVQPSLKVKQSHPLWKLHWCLCFPSAEQYLETCFSQAQMTVYTIALMLHKTFIRSTFGLDVAHIRNMLFWMAERQPEWSELEMG